MTNTTIPSAIVEPSFTDGVPVYECPETGKLSEFPYSPLPRAAKQRTLMLGAFGGYLDGEDFHYGE